MFERSFNAVTGSIAPALGVVVSFQEQVDAHLRTASLLVGLSIGLVSLFNGLNKKR
jgi:hypothetical protein